jgi:hypothetical protein
MEFSFVGIEGRRERVIESNRTVGGSSRETVLVRTADTKPFHFLPLLSLARGVHQ